MLKQEYQLLIDANEAREYSIEYEDTIEALSKEKEYLGLVERYANHRVFIEETIQIIENLLNSSLEIAIEVSMVLLYSNNEIYIDKILAYVIKDEHKFPFEKVLSRLSEEKQIQIIEKLLTYQTKAALTVAGKCILANGYSAFVTYFYNDNTLVETDENIAYSLLCRLGGEEEKIIVESLFLETTHPIKKEMLALELVHAKAYDAREYIKKFYTLDSFSIFPFLSMSEDIELYKQIVIEHIDENDNDFIEAYCKIMLWYGNPKLISFYITMLENIDVCMQFNELLLRFFMYDEHMEPLEEVMENWDDYLESIAEEENYDMLFEKESRRVQTYIIDFWKHKETYIHNNIDMNKKYYIDKLFDIVEIWENAVEDFSEKEITLLYKTIQLLTGQYFAFDIKGLRSRQIEQSKTIIVYLKENKSLYKKGDWYVWGKRTEEELKSFIINQNINKISKENNDILPDDFLNKN